MQPPEAEGDSSAMTLPGAAGELENHVTASSLELLLQKGHLELPAQVSSITVLHFSVREETKSCLQPLSCCPALSPDAIAKSPCSRDGVPESEELGTTSTLSNAQSPAQHTNKAPVKPSAHTSLWQWDGKVPSQELPSCCFPHSLTINTP